MVDFGCPEIKQIERHIFLKISKKILVISSTSKEKTIEIIKKKTILVIKTYIYLSIKNCSIIFFFLWILLRIRRDFLWNTLINNIQDYCTMQNTLSN